MLKVKAYITEHAEKRLKRRHGLGKSASQRIADRALVEGISFKRTKGSLNAYIMGIYNRYNCEANNIKIYHQFIFLFKRNKLITVYHLPQKYYKYIEKLIEERDKIRKIRNETDNVI